MHSPAPTIIAQNLNASGTSFADALMGGDAGWVRDLALRLSRTGVHALDLCVSSVAPSVETEVQLLDWACQCVESVTELPVFLDSPRPEVLLRCRRPRRVAPTLNSVACDEWSELVARLEPGERAGQSWVVQLRAKGALPTTAEQRLEWTEQLLTAMRHESVDLGRVWVDPVCLPWGSDFGAGQPVVDYLRAARAQWPDLRLLIGLGNLSWGHPDRPGLHRRWAALLREAGADGFLLDPLETGLIELVGG